MSESRKKYDQEVKDGAVRMVEESEKPVAQVARDLLVNEGTLRNWVAKARAASDLGGSDRMGVRSSSSSGRRSRRCGSSAMCSSDPWSAG
jgi:transposase